MPLWSTLKSSLTFLLLRNSSIEECLGYSCCPVSREDLGADPQCDLHIPTSTLTGLPEMSGVREYVREKYIVLLLLKKNKPLTPQLLLEGCSWIVKHIPKNTFFVLYLGQCKQCDSAFCSTFSVRTGSCDLCACSTLHLLENTRQTWQPSLDIWANREEA